ncbi:CDP-diacylglycerol--serine O-phosphatidyltransferase [Caloramator quimbayensis]|uniref:CDP-diacylglycerol--serine O-phosphatidyltransferase n=1 Tax=Caloramator quimbayensis TaxID=1147123 RepID=A0A1T4X753_9CLOT|nr:CDP-diacylglycerol--serine O-phosphatidyltransferase [Caloramator quimbayensis]SKA85376.1 CDP-diacylglycerol--serine O-phosphatidyltransferase [Caloramator quimbayensis]
MNFNIIPSLLTFSNLSFGMLSILFTLTNNTKLASLMILLSVIVDRYDGKIARKLDAVTLFGKELDSLSDLVSFGAAPAVLCWNLFLNQFGIIGYIITILYPIAGAYRLARFNVTQFDNVYMGIPITIAGGLVAVDCLINIYFIKHNLFSAVLIVILSYLMISKIKIQKR